MENPADIDALTDRGWSPTAEQTELVARTWLGVVWRALKRDPEVPDLARGITSGDLSEDDVIDVIAAATLRVLRNPEGREAEDFSIDDYREGWRKSDVTQDVYFTAAEKRRLQPAVTDGEAENVGWSGSMKYS